MFYYGGESDHSVSKVLLFLPRERVVAAVLNVPKCVDDYQIFEWGKMYVKVKNLLKETSKTIVVDSAFEKGR